MRREQAVTAAKGSVRYFLLESGLWEWAQTQQTGTATDEPVAQTPAPSHESDNDDLDDWQAEFEQALLELEAEEVEEETPAVEPEPVADTAAVATRGNALTEKNVQEVLDELVRPALQADGGDISLIKVEDNNIYVELIGACASCPSSTMTMKMGIEQMLHDEFPDLNELINIAGEAQPYF